MRISRVSVGAKGGLIETLKDKMNEKKRERVSILHACAYLESNPGSSFLIFSYILQLEAAKSILKTQLSSVGYVEGVRHIKVIQIYVKWSKEMCDDYLHNVCVVCDWIGGE